jgi:hypothetical protein
MPDDGPVNREIMARFSIVLQGFSSVPPFTTYLHSGVRFGTGASPPTAHVVALLSRIMIPLL